MLSHAQQHELRLDVHTLDDDLACQRLERQLTRKGAPILEYIDRLPPSEELWTTLVQRVEWLGESAITDIDERLTARGWADALRTAPATWLRNPPPHAWQLVRRIAPAPGFDLASTPPLDHITELDFRYLPHHRLSFSSFALARFFDTANLGSLRVLHLDEVMPTLSYSISEEPRTSYYQRENLRAWRALLTASFRLQTLTTASWISTCAAKDFAVAPNLRNLQHLQLRFSLRRANRSDETPPLSVLAEAPWADNLRSFHLEALNGVSGFEEVIAKARELRELHLSLYEPRALLPALDALHHSGAELESFKLELRSRADTLDVESLLDHPAMRALRALHLDSERLDVQALRRSLSHHDSLKKLALPRALLSPRQLHTLAGARLDALSLSPDALSRGNCINWRVWRPIRSSRDDVQARLQAIFAIADEPALTPEQKRHILGRSPTPLSEATQALLTIPTTGNYRTLYVACRDFDTTHRAVVFAAHHESGSLDILQAHVVCARHLDVATRVTLERLLRNGLRCERVITDGSVEERAGLRASLGSALPVLACPRHTTEDMMWSARSKRSEVRHIMRGLRRGWYTTREAASRLQELGVPEAPERLEELALDDSLNPLDKAGLESVLEGLRGWAEPGPHLGAFLFGALALRQLRAARS